MDITYECKYFKRNVVPACYPDNSNYSIFYQSKYKSTNALYNEIASAISNYDCYGNAYVVHFDNFYQLYDIDKFTFINSYNNMRSTHTQIKDIIKNNNTKKNNVNHNFKYHSDNNSCNCSIM